MSRLPAPLRCRYISGIGQVKTVRFYEEVGILPPPQRTESGYRTFSQTDLRRLRLARRARLLGLALPEVKSLVEQAFASDCASFADQLLQVIGSRKVEIDQRIQELQAFRQELAALEGHLRHAREEAAPGQMVAECEYCPIIDQKGGEIDERG